MLHPISLVFLVPFLSTLRPVLLQVAKKASHLSRGHRSGKRAISGFSEKTGNADGNR
jgi:hypothetical protein